jgi:anti-anti-sigma factor
MATTIKLSLNEYDLASVPELRAELSHVGESDMATLDLGLVTYIDSTCLGILAATADKMDRHGGSLRFTNVPPPIRKLLEICGAGHYIAG